MEQRTQKTNLDLIREQKPEEMMSAANCGMQDEKTHEKEAEGILRKRAQNLGRPPAGPAPTEWIKPLISAASPIGWLIAYASGSTRRKPM